MHERVELEGEVGSEQAAYVEKAAQKGVGLLLFPEECLTGFGTVPMNVFNPDDHMVHLQHAELIPEGPSTIRAAATTPSSRPVLARSVLRSALTSASRRSRAACAVSYSLFLYLNARVATGVHPVPRSFLLLVSGALITAVISLSLFTSDIGHVVAIAPSALVLGAMTIAPVLCISYASSRVSGGALAILASMELPAAVTTGILILGDATSAIKVAGVLLIMLGTLASESRGFPKKKTRQSRPIEQ